MSDAKPRRQRPASPVRLRRRARKAALQALYQWQVGGGNVGDIIAQFEAEHPPGHWDQDYFRELVREVTARVGELDGLLDPLVSRPLKDVDPVELATLRIAAYELAHRPEIPYRVVINEAVDLAKTFGAEQGYRFVNGIVDKLAQQLRQVEIQAARTGDHGRR